MATEIIKNGMFVKTVFIIFTSIMVGGGGWLYKTVQDVYGQQQTHSEVMRITSRQLEEINRSLHELVTTKEYDKDMALLHNERLKLDARLGELALKTQEMFLRLVQVELRIKGLEDKSIPKNP